MNDIGQSGGILPPFVRRAIGPRPLGKFEPTIDGLESEWTKSGGGALEHPFQIQFADDTHVNVRFGTVQDLAPSNVATDIAIAGDGTYAVYLDVTISLVGEPTAVVIVVATGAMPANADDHAYILIGQVIVADGVITTINQAATHSLRFGTCDRIVEEGVLIERGTYEFWGF